MRDAKMCPQRDLIHAPISAAFCALISEEAGVCQPLGQPEGLITTGISQKPRKVAKYPTKRKGGLLSHAPLTQHCAR